MNDDTQLRISAGRGPHEARRFVAMLTEALCARLAARRVPVEELERHGDRDAPGRVLLRVRGEASSAVQPLVGTHLLLAELRGPKARRRWFAEVELERAPGTREIVLPRHTLDIRFVRSRGPGGQNVNKRATAVQITHRPTGLSVSCDGHRSQARNRAEALDLLRDAVARHERERQQQERTETWQSRRALLTREPVMRWRLHPEREATIIPA